MRYHFSKLEIFLARFLSWRSNQVIRTFWFHHPIRKAVHRMFHDQPVRLLLDIATGTRDEWKGFQWHTDAATFGVLNENASLSTSLWCPLWDSEVLRLKELNVDTGGTLAIVPNKTLSHECSPILSRIFATSDCKDEYERNKVVITVKLGDCLLFDRKTLHRTDMFRPAAYVSSTLPTRYTLIGRFASSNSIGNRLEMLTSNKVPRLPHQFCIPSTNQVQVSSDSLYNILTPCHPEIYPRVDDSGTSTTYHPVIQQIWNQVYLHGVNTFSGILFGLGMQ
jgi:hypothetical protein